MASRGKNSNAGRRSAYLVGALAACVLCVSVPVLAQDFGSRSPSIQLAQAPPFFPFFRSFEPRRRQQQRAPVRDYSHAPAADEKKDDNAPAPVSTIVVLGDSMADWLAYGLSDILSERPEIGVTRKHHTRSGLIHYDSKDDSKDWATVARQTLAGEKANAVVMMIGLRDRTSIRESEQPQTKKTKTSSEQPSIAAPERKRSRAERTHKYKSEEWVALYIKRIDATIAALKSRAVPVFWVGLPPIRGKRSTSDMAFLNDIFRDRAAKAGITYVDVWDGFVNDQGRYVVYGPDYEGQRRRLRSGDGVHFTKAGARKLAHFVEREIRRVMGNRLVPVALPTSDEPLPQVEVTPGKPAPRPLAGPVVPLTATPVDDRELLGAGGVRPPRADPIASRVLTKGEAAPRAEGRADDFAWPREGKTVAAEPPAADDAAKPAKAKPTKAKTVAPEKKASSAPVKKPAPAKKPKAAAAPTKPRARSDHAVARRNTATVAGQPVLRPPAPIR